MKFDPQPSDALRVEGYAGRGYTAGGQVWPAGLLISATTLVGFEALDTATLAPLQGRDPPIDLLLIGTGAQMRRPAADLLAWAASHAIATEFMDSRAAARTYNVLVAEGREVAAALMPIDIPLP